MFGDGRDPLGRRGQVLHLDLAQRPVPSGSDGAGDGQIASATGFCVYRATDPEVRLDPTFDQQNAARVQVRSEVRNRGLKISNLGQVPDSAE
jgi:hypothetical protein